MHGPNKLGAYSRSVSIIGVGATPFINVFGNPDWEGVSETELFAMAASEAMNDAGVKPKDIDMFYHGQAHPYAYSDSSVTGVHYADWIGMRGKGFVAHSEGCCTSYVALEEAVMAVASGKCDIVLTGCVEMAESVAIPGEPSCNRRKLEMPDLMNALGSMASRDYSRWNGASGIEFDIEMEGYARKNHLDDAQVHEVLGALAKSARYMSSKNPRALKQMSYEDEAAMMGFDNVDDYLNSDFNPHLGQFLRISDSEAACAGAAVAIVCPTELAFKYTETPVEVLGSGHSTLEFGHAHLESRATQMAYKQVSEATGLTGADMDLFMCNDFFCPSQIISSEICEYLPEGEAWKYFLDGRTTFDGDKPINTNGGRAQYGHAYGASGLADVYEVVHQMRGDCGEHQIQKPVKTAMLRGFGGGQNVLISILRAVEKEA